MRRRRNVFPFGYAGCLRRPVFFCLGRKGIQPLFLCAAKKKPLAVKRKRQRGICVGTNSTSPILSAACGGQASSVPLFLLFPHESLRWIRVGTLPLCKPPENDQGRGDSSSLEPSPLRISEMAEFHTSNIQRAQTEQLARNIVRLGNPIRRSARRAFLAGRAFGERHAESKCLFCATALFRSPAPLFSPFFSGKTEKNGPSETHRAIPAHTSLRK